MLRYPATDDANRAAHIRWWRGNPALKFWRTRGIWRPILPVGSLVAIPILLALLAAFNGPFVVAMVLFSPFASLLIVIGLSLALAAIAAWRGYLSNTIRAQALAGECPSCGYDLPEYSSAADSLTICPECGAAWNLEPHAPPHVVIVAKP